MNRHERYGGYNERGEQERHKLDTAQGYMMVGPGERVDRNSSGSE